LLTKLKLSAKEIASVLGISTGGVILNQSRLCSRFYLDPGEENLEKYVDGI
jgi:hypothetical protein